MSPRGKAKGSRSHLDLAHVASSGRAGRFHRQSHSNARRLPRPITAHPLCAQRPASTQSEGNHLAISTPRAGALIALVLLLACQTALSQDGAKAIPEHARAAYGGWDCNRGFVKTGDSCTLIEVPAKRVPELIGQQLGLQSRLSEGRERLCGHQDLRLTRMRTIPTLDKAGDATAATAVQATACTAVVIPANAYSVDSTYGKEVGVRPWLSRDDCVMCSGARA